MSITTGFWNFCRNSVAIFAATATRLFALNATNQTWSDVSAGAGSYPAVSSTDQWQFAQYINFVIAVHHRLGVNIPELDYPKLMTLDSAVAYLKHKLAAKRS